MTPLNVSRIGVEAVMGAPKRLTAALREQQAEGRRLDALIGQALGGLGL
jgi:hypothetical protein